MAQFSYLEVGGALAWLHKIADDKKPAFQARLKHLQKLRFPPGTNTGKGRPAVYSFEAMCQMLAALELIQLGMLPHQAVLFITQNWTVGRLTFASALAEVAVSDAPRGRQFGQSWLWVITPEALRELTESGESEQDYANAVEFLRLHELEAELWKINQDEENEPILGSDHRVAFINITSVVRQLKEVVSKMQLRDSLLEAREWFADRKAVKSLGDELVSKYRSGVGHGRNKKA